MPDGGASGRTRCRLHFARDPEGATRLIRQHIAYPLHVTRPFSLAGDPSGMCTLYLQSSSGGLFQGDDLALDVRADAGAAVHLTTQAATVAHAMPRAPARFDVSLGLGPGTHMEYLPDPLILLPGADAALAVDATVPDDASLVLSDSFLAHDPAGAGCAAGRLETSIAIARPDGRAIVHDRSLVDVGILGAGDPGVAGGAIACGLFLVLTRRVPPDDLTAALLAAIESVPGIYGGASSLPGSAGAAARVLADDGQGLRAATEVLWVAARVALTGAPPPGRRK